VLPTLVIGLREGLEAALIVGIVAAFLRTNGRLDLLKWVWAGVAAAVVLCLAVGVGLEVAAENLPYRQQEALETVIALVAVAMVTTMIVWMKRHARYLRAELETAAGDALESGSAWALVGMAFLAVVREGFETAVFLVAAFNESDDPRIAATGALIGIVIACGIGYGIYQGGLRLDLARFFTVTGVVLVLVAAGLVASALHSAHEADWVNVGQQQAFDLTWLVEPGSVQSSLLTGILGLQPRPTVIEIVGWLAYLIPTLTYVLWPASRPFPRRAVVAGLAVTSLGAAVGAIVVGGVGPARPDTNAPVELMTADGSLVVDVAAAEDGTVMVHVAGDALGSPPADLTMTAIGTEDRAGREAVVHESEPQEVAGSAATRTVSLTEVAELNGGRLPLGINAETDPGDIDVTTSTHRTATVWVDAETGLVLDAEVASTDRTVADLSAGPLPLGAADAVIVGTTESSAVDRAAAVATAAVSNDRADRFDAWSRLVVSIAVAAAIAGVVLWLAGRRQAGTEPPAPQVAAVSRPAPSTEPARQAHPV
jgi:high-affinity iron transporter